MKDELQHIEDVLHYEHPKKLEGVNDDELYDYDAEQEEEEEFAKELGEVSID